MSTNSTLDDYDQEILTQFATASAGRYSTLSAAAVILYDFLLTFPLEVQYIWYRKTNIMKILFILNRYFSLTYFCGFVFLYFFKRATDTACGVFYYIAEISDTFVPIATTSIFILRTFAIYGKSWAVLFLLTIPALVQIASNIWLTIAQTTYALPAQFQIGPFTCNFNVSSSGYSRFVFDPQIMTIVNASILFHSSLVSFVSGSVFDVLVVLLTLYRTARLVIQSKETNTERSLSFILLRDGIFYYSAIFLPSFANIVLSAIVLRTGSSILSNVSAVFNTINNTFEIVLVNRLVLNLCHSATVQGDSRFRSRTGVNPPVFAKNSFLGDIGGPVYTPSLPVELDDDVSNDEWQADTAKGASIIEIGRLNFNDGDHSCEGVDVEESISRTQANAMLDVEQK